MGELAGQDAVVHEALLDDEVAGLAGGVAGTLSREALLDDPPGVGRVLLEPGRELLAQGGLDDALHLGVAEARLGLALELRFGELDADDRNEALSSVLARKVGVVVLEDLLP